MTPSSSTTHPKTATRKTDTGVTDPKEAQRIIDSTREEINHSHQRNLAAIDRMAKPFKKYVQQEELVIQLAKSREQCENLKLENTVDASVAN